MAKKKTTDKMMPRFWDLLTYEDLVSDNWARELRQLYYELYEQFTDDELEYIDSVADWLC